MTSFGNFFRSFGTRRAIRSYARQLPRLLVRDYGYSRTYTPQQVRRTVERSGLSVAHSCYAIAMFSDRDGFNHFHREMGEHCRYDAMRLEIADCHFSGKSDFTISDIHSVSSDAGFDAGHGGSHDGGGGGGHGGDGGSGSH
jgi:uncharacterized protein DUF6559